MHKIVSWKIEERSAPEKLCVDILYVFCIGLKDAPRTKYSDCEIIRSDGGWREWDFALIHYSDSSILSCA